MRLTLFDRYIASTMFKATVLTLVVLVTLLIFFGLIDEMDDVGRGDYRLADAFFVAVLSAPRYVFEVFPVAALIGSLIGLGAMGAHNELIAMRSSGYSRRQIVFAVMKAGLVMMVLVFLFGELVAPASEQLGEQHRMAPSGFGDADAETDIAGAPRQVAQEHLVVVVAMRRAALARRPREFGVPQGLGNEPEEVVDGPRHIEAQQTGDPEQGIDPR